MWEVSFGAIAVFQRTYKVLFAWTQQTRIPSAVISAFATSPTPQRSSISTSSQGCAHPSDLPHPQLYSHRLSPIPSCCHLSSQSTLIGITVFVPRSETAASHHSHHHLWGETAPSVQVESGRAITSICFNQVLEGWQPLMSSSCWPGATIASRTIADHFSTQNTAETST